MTLSELLTYIDGVKPNAYSNDQKTGWVGDLEQAVWVQTFLQSAAGAPKRSYTTEQNLPLLLPEAWRSLYEAYLTARIDFANGEYSKYANALEMVNARLRELEAWWAQTYRPADNPAGWVRLGSYSFGDGAEKALMTLPAGTAVLCVKARVDQAFNAEESIVTLGTAEQPQALMGAELDPTAAGTAVRRSLWTAEEGDAALYAAGSFTGTPTAGSIVFTALLQPGRRA